MDDTKVVSCLDCGVDVEVHKYCSLSKVRCPPHTAARRRDKQKKDQRRYRAKLKRERLGHSNTSYTCVCIVCGTKFRGQRPEIKLCSYRCVAKHSFHKFEGKTSLRECVDCGVEVEVSWAAALSRVRCEPHREAHRELMKDRHRATKRNVKHIELGQAPYEDYVVVGPVWCSRVVSYGWRVTVKHKSNSNKREMSLAHYNLSVKLGRRIPDREVIVFLNGDEDNCDPLNLLLETEKEVA